MTSCASALCLHSTHTGHNARWRLPCHTRRRCQCPRTWSRTADGDGVDCTRMHVAPGAQLLASHSFGHHSHENNMPPASQQMPSAVVISSFDMTETSNNSVAPGVRSPFSRRLLARLVHRLTPRTVFVVIALCLLYNFFPKLQWLLRRLRSRALSRLFAIRSNV